VVGTAARGIFTVLAPLGRARGYQSRYPQSSEPDAPKLLARSQETQSGAQQTRLQLVLINAAESIDDLRVPPGNRLEKLVGARAGQYSIRVNDQLRICFPGVPAAPRMSSWSTISRKENPMPDFTPLIRGRSP
jgi:plasmid maintenance system killer protein